MATWLGCLPSFLQPSLTLPNSPSPRVEPSIYAPNRTSRCIFWQYVRVKMKKAFADVDDELTLVVVMAFLLFSEYNCFQMGYDMKMWMRKNLNVDEFC